MQTLYRLFLLLLIGGFSTVWAAENNYRLGEGDVIRVTVYDHPDLTTEVQLAQDGSITFPLVGRVALTGSTFPEAESKIAQRLKDGGFILKPSVNVMITQYRSSRVSVLGEVVRPNRINLERSTDLLEVLALAGGVSPNGGDRVWLVRGGAKEEYLLPELLQQMAGGGQLPMVNNGDTVFVPRMAMVYVMGEVNRPGAFRLENRMTVLQALAVAGGFNQRASHRSIVIHRTDAKGVVNKLNASQTDSLLEGDVVFVEERLF